MFRTNSRRWLFAAVVLAAATVATSLGLDANPSPPHMFVATAHTSGCGASPATILGAGTEPTDKFTFYRDRALRLRVCSPSLLSFDANGTQVSGTFARVLVTEGSTTVVETPVDKERRFSVALRPGAWVLVTFPNDAYMPPQDRNLQISGLRVSPVN